MSILYQKPNFVVGVLSPGLTLDGVPSDVNCTFCPINTNAISQDAIKNQIEEAHVLIADLSVEQKDAHKDTIVLAKEAFDRRVIAISPQTSGNITPWIRRHCDYIVESQSAAVELAHIFSKIKPGASMSKIYVENRERISNQIRRILRHQGIGTIEQLLPTELVRRWKKLFGLEFYNKLLRYSFGPLQLIASVNTLKTEAKRFMQDAVENSAGIKEVPFFPDTFHIPSPSPENLTAFIQSGMIYYNDLVSQLPAKVLNPHPQEDILFLGAVRSQRVVQTAAIMQNTGSITVADRNWTRLDEAINFSGRLGVSNALFNSYTEQYIKEADQDTYDRVLVLSPSSYEGIFRVKPYKILQWSEQVMHRLTEIQKNLLFSGFEALKKGGTLVYTTSTYAPEENEEVVNSLLEVASDAEVEAITFPGIKTRGGMVKWNGNTFHESLSKTVRIYPNGSLYLGIYVAKIKKR